MLTLTKVQEKYVLNNIDYEQRIDSGSSRAVFYCQPYVLEYLGIKTDRECVIKLAVGQGGLSQHQTEVEMWLDSRENKLFLGEIFAAGQFVSIMEHVDVEDWSDMAEDVYGDDDPDETARNYLEYCCGYEEDEDNYDERLKEARKVAETVTFLAGYNGRTSDNGQLGKTKDGRYVAYDYGFVAGVGCSTQCSGELVDNIYDEDCFIYYIEQLCEVLDIQIKAEQKLDDVMRYMKAIEYTINRGDWDEKVLD